MQYVLAADWAFCAAAQLPVMGSLGFYDSDMYRYHWLAAHAVPKQLTAMARLKMQLAHALYCLGLVGHVVQEQLPAMEVLRSQQVHASCCHGLVAHAAHDPTRKAQCLTVIGLDCPMPAVLGPATGAGWSRIDLVDGVLWWGHNFHELVCHIAWRMGYRLAQP